MPTPTHDDMYVMYKNIRNNKEKHTHMSTPINDMYINGNKI